MCSSVPRVSNPGNNGAGIRDPLASNQSEEGPGKMRIPWPGQIGLWLVMPSV
ncbi:Uncharacterised protein [Mycobacteroides abscessus subsp. abscessus]|nr:Uncharacterised protein [Mycobacteroides abscessus subsp. abscessus]